MNDLDDLIRASLDAHTPLAPHDDTLAGRVATTGRRIRRARTVGVLAVALVAVGAVAWSTTALPALFRPVVAASPVRPSPSSPATTPSVGATVRDVTRMGGPGENSNVSGTFLNNYFASPTGNLLCFINTKGAGCDARKWNAGVQPSIKKACPGSDVPVGGPEVWGNRPAAWECRGDPSSFPNLDEPLGDGVAWWDAGFGESIPDPANPSTNLAVLPYGKTLVAGDLRCSMAKDGVTCTNTRTGEGFHASRSKVTLKP